MEVQQQDELRFSDILAIVWKRFIWIFAISVIAAIVCALVTGYVISPSKEIYQLSFSIEYPNQYATDKDGNLTNKMLYPDGTEFRVDSLIYISRLEAAKETDESFENINVENMVNRDKISISQKQSSVTSDPDGIFTITVSANCFRNSTQAMKFLKAVLEKGKEEIVKKTLNKECYSDLLNYDSVTVSKKLDMLKTRHSDLLNTYSRYRVDYKNFVYENKTLETYYSNAKVVNLDLVSAYELENEREKNIAAIDALKQQLPSTAASNVSIDPITQKISEYIVRNALIDFDLTQIYRTFDYRGEVGKFSVSEVFSEKMSELKETIVSETLTLNHVISALYNNETMFTQQGGVCVAGGANILVYTVMIFIVAFLAASILFCAIDISRKRKAQRVAAASQSQEAQTAQDQREEISEEKKD